MNCDCLKTVLSQLSEKGFVPKTPVTGTIFSDQKLTSKMGMSIKRENGKTRRDDQRMLFFTYCPFCAKKS